MLSLVSPSVSPSIKWELKLNVNKWSLKIFWWITLEKTQILSPQNVKNHWSLYIKMFLSHGLKARGQIDMYLETDCYAGDEKRGSGRNDSQMRECRGFQQHEVTGDHPWGLASTYNAVCWLRKKMGEEFRNYFLFFSFLHPSVNAQTNILFKKIY